MSAAHILVVDDDPKVRTLLRRCLEGEGFAVSDAKDGAELRACLQRQQISLITLDLNLGEENGLDLARDIRKERNVPIIMLTGKGDAIDRVTPTRSAGSTGQRYAFEGWVLDITGRSLKSGNGDEQDLTTSEFNLLEAFVKRPHRVLSRDDIMDLLKGHDWSPLDRSIDNLVARLRKKIEKDPDRPALIKTVRGVGYTFTADVERAGSEHLQRS
jgi:two-component system OmpR family response regulator